MQGRGTTPVYDQILNHIEKHFEINGEDVVNLLNEAQETRSWVVKGSLTVNTEFTTKFDGIMYDLYSAKVMSEYWTEPFLQRFISIVAGPHCGFATYSAKSTLKRALTNCGFNVVDRPGFQGKRESTLAFR